MQGLNLVVQRYSGEGRTEYYPALARVVVQSGPNLIFASGEMVKHLKAVTTTIPIRPNPRDEAVGGAGAPPTNKSDDDDPDSSEPP